MTIKWISAHAVYAIHSEQIAEHGGGTGVRDDNLLFSALEAPRQYHHYQQNVSIPALAAMYAHRLIKNHPFIDGNKRTGYIIARVFLVLNGYDVFASEEERLFVVFNMADGSLSEAETIRWFEAHCRACGC